MAQFIVPPVKDLRDSQNDVQVPVSYSNSNGLGLFLSRLDVSRGTGIERTITRDQFISGNYDFPLPSGYVPVPYQLPMIEPKNVLLKGDTAICYMPVTKYIIGTASSPLTGSIRIKINKTNITQGGITFAPFVEGQIYVLNIYVQGAIIDWGNSDFGAKKYTDSYLRSVSKWRLRFYMDGGNVCLLDINENGFLNTGMESVPVGSGLLSNMLLEIYNLANRGATGAAGGDLAGNYPNPVIGSRKVTGAKIALEGVGYENMAQNSVGNYNLRTDSVQSNVIQNGSVTNIKIALGTITGDRITSQTITEDKVVRGTLTSLSFNPGSINGNRLVNRTVNTEQLADASVDRNKLTNNSVPTEKIVDGAVTQIKLAAASVGTPEIINESVTGAKLSATMQSAVKYRMLSFIVGRSGAITESSEPGIVENVDVSTPGEIKMAIAAKYTVMSLVCSPNWGGGQEAVTKIPFATLDQRHARVTIFECNKSNIDRWSIMLMVSVSLN